MPTLETPPVSRVRETRMHGLKGGLALLLPGQKPEEG